MAKSAITDLLDLQGEDLARLQDSQAAAVLRLANESRRELKEAYEALMASGGAKKTPYTAQQMRVMLAQSERMVLVLRQRLDESLTVKAKLAGEKALRDLLKVIRANEPDFKDAGNRVEMRALARISADQGLLLHRYSLDRYSSELMDAIQRELGVGLLRGLSIPQITERVAGTSKSVFAGKMHRAELIARMELNGAYNAMHQASLEEAAAELDDPDDPDPLLRRIDEYFDTRNNPFSRAAHGTVAGLKAPFRVSASAVAAAAAQLGKRVSGIVWALEGAAYVGMALPAHYNERGRQVPHRASWEPGYVAPPVVVPVVTPTKPAWAPPAINPFEFHAGGMAAAEAYQAFVAKQLAEAEKAAKAAARREARKAAALAAAEAAKRASAENILATKVGEAQGSNPGGTYRGADGVLRYVKRYPDPAQAYGEQLANAIYKDLGVDGPTSTVFRDAGGTLYHATDIIPNAKQVGTSGLTKEIAKQTLRGFAADVLVANWDAVGMSLDNIVVSGGKVYRIDNGGSFLMRAKAGRKPVELLNQLTEWEKFADHKNPSYFSVFKAAGYSEAVDIDGIEKQVKAIATLRKKAGGWDAYVKKVIGDGLAATDRAAVVSMLEARSSKLDATLQAAKTRKAERAAAEVARLKAEQAARDAGLKALESLPAVEKALLKRTYVEYARHTSPETQGYIERLAGVHPKLSPEAFNAVKNYTSSGYNRTNSRLRIGGKLTPTDQAMNEGLRQGTVLQDTVLWRGVGSHPELHEATPPPPGRIYLEKGFCSTAVSKDKAFSGPYLFKILVPKETQLLYVDTVSSVKGEKEAILPTGAKFRVLSVRSPTPGDSLESGRTQIVEMLLLPPEK